MGQEMNLYKRMRLYLSMIRYGNAHNKDFAKEHVAFFKEMELKLKSINISLSNKRILDVGCGKSYWLTLLLHSYGADVSGIDSENVESGFHFQKYLNIYRQNGIERSLRTFVWDRVYAKPYYNALAEASSFPISFDRVDTHTMSVTDLNFADNTFDLIVSHEVFEHLPDLDASLLSLYRVLKPNGLTYIYIHNFASISGGHHIAWKYPDTEPSDTVPPWDHLRENKFPEIPSWINKLRIDDYKSAFNKYFEIVDWIYSHKEGEALLTDEIKQELENYGEEELLTKGFVVIAKPKSKIDHS